ncbi:MAG: hypothetical protein JWO42_2472 [Chloroflexi bacterium]|nr:hypothetical protein [Chloroflexota bacterium]
MLSPGITSGARVARRPQQHFSTSQAVAHHIATWVSPTLTDSVRLQARAHRENRPGTADLRDTLVTIRRDLRRAWLVAVVRRSLLCALPVAAILAIVGHWQQWPGWIGPVVALFVLAGVLAVTRLQAPGPDAVARYLDRELDLKEQLATALELKSAVNVSSSMLATETQRRAAATARNASGSWSARTASAAREWAGLALLLCAVVAAIAVPFGGSQSASQTATSAPGGATGLGAVPVVPTIPARIKPMAVQVSVVSKQNSSSPAAQIHVKAPQAQTQPVAGHRISPKPSQAANKGRGAGSSKGSSAANKANGKVGAANGQHTMPLMGQSQRFLPTTPTDKGKKGAFYTNAPNKSGAKIGGASSGKGAASGHGASGSAKSGSQGKQGNQSAGQQNSGAGGKQSGAKGSPTQCLYGCAHITASQLTKPGLITGKGQFAGKGIPGGQTAGHSQGAASKLGSAKSQAASTSKHQLNITSGYAPTNTSGRSAKQVTGHNGAGSSQQSIVAAGSNGGQTIDYVPPDANVVLPGDNTIVGRYFTSQSPS